MSSFTVICADPPWAFEDKLTMSDVKRGAQSNYPVLDINAIARLDIPSVTADIAILALWCPSTMLADGLRVINAWGFDYKQMCVWTKSRIGLGRCFRNQHEIALIGMRGKYTKIIRNHSQSTMIQTE